MACYRMRGWFPSANVISPGNSSLITFLHISKGNDTPVAMH
jgi:hypothetical protein